VTFVPDGSGSSLPSSPGRIEQLAYAWWALLILRGVLPACLAVVGGLVIGAVAAGGPIVPSLVWFGVVFVALQVLAPVHQAISANLGDRTAAWLYDRLTEACARPPGIAHLEDATLTTDLAVARDFDLGMTGPPLSISIEFIAGGLVGMITGIASALILFGYAWWAPLLLSGAWLATHWLLRESGVWRDRNTAQVRAAQRDADYAYRLAVDASPAKELRLFGLAEWTLRRFVERRSLLHRLQYDATRLRERPVLWSLLLVLGANVLFGWALAQDATSGAVTLAAAAVFAQTAIGTSAIAFGGLNWAMDGAAAPVASVLRLEPAMKPAGALVSGSRTADGLPAREIRFRDVTFAYPGGAPILDHFDLTIPAGTSLAIVGQNGAGKTTLAKLICRLYDPQSGAIEVDGIDLRDCDLGGWRRRVTAVFQDFIRFERPLRDNVAPHGAPDEVDQRGTGARGCDGTRHARHGTGPWLHRRHRPLGRPVAARGAGPRHLRRAKWVGGCRAR
jgi:ABC-type multidrug transport system fused ATPase/permease subunit